ncbi:MAG: diadenylate cyclase CdaA [Thermodesulfobacteriota bacterium]|nr:diadenylate cyclase CdaA [Thermodesulfobacteriota bacterium]
MFEIGALRISWRELLDIGLVAFIFYRVILLVKGTRAVSVIYGLVLLLVVYYLSGEFGLFTLNWLLANFLGSIFLVVIILFQRDVRKALSQVGAGGLWRRAKAGEDVVNQLASALLSMAEKRIGALVVIEKNVPLGDVVDRGVKLSARISRDLLLTIFFPDSPLHDGAVIINGDEILAAGCILPLAVGVKRAPMLGTRHRAALGITEETDAVAVVVSEESGRISVAAGGEMTASLDEVRLKRVLKKAWEK